MGSTHMIGLKITLFGINLVLGAIFLGEGAWGLAYLGMFVSLIGVFAGSNGTPPTSE
ncbi:hypothetical protein SAMN04515672_0100 [Natronorubrum texcoconense]|uniref:Uncharacterized protein n=1 Tax=Natronorubrum texcoconense TaxID=1095776 RepID=A0A1G9H1L6_9EURY|nr:hypothetical protein SAMN04515672_0100 [Natronorubrum texcoconense]